MINLDLIIGIINIVLIATTPLVFAGIGELVTEKTGVLNLGVEGMMLVGAVTAFVTLVLTGSYFLAFLFSIISGLLYVRFVCIFSFKFNGKSGSYWTCFNNFWHWSKLNDWQELYWYSYSGS